MLHWVQLGHTSLTHLKQRCQEMRCWCASCRFCLWTPRDFFVREGHIMDIPEIPEERIIVLDNKILLGKLSLWTSEFFKEVKACLRFFGTRTCRRSLKIQAVLLPLEKSQQYAVTIHSLSQSARGCKRICEIGHFHNWGKRSWHSWMSDSQMFQKVESGWGPIFKVVLEC